MIPIYKPYLPKGSLDLAHEALDSTWISSQGKYLQIASEKLQELLGVKHVQLVFNGTVACHLLAKAAGALQTQEVAEVIVPNNVYAAAWNAFLFDTNYTLYSVDADLDTWNYDLLDLDLAIHAHPHATVLIVHNVGNIINVPELQRAYPNTVFVEDNCEGFLGKYEGLQSGTSSFASAISFFGNKNITSGEGGAFITNDDDAYEHAKCIQSQGQSKKRFVHDYLGYNYRMTNIQAAILAGQLELLPTILEMKRQVFTTYRTALADREDVLMQLSDPTTEHSNWMFGLRVPKQLSYERAELFFKQNGVEIRPMFYPIHEHGYLKKNFHVKWDDCTNAEILSKECFILPSYPELTEDEQSHILTTLNDYIESYDATQFP
jgi:perosamine synthetase